MLNPRLRNWSLLALCGLLFFGAFGCDETPPDPSTLKPWHFESTQAPYAMEVPGQWVKMPAEELNRFADVALRVQHRFYLIVIPQQLPQFEGVTPPDALDLKRASLGLLKERVKGFEIEREGPLQLGGKTALTVFARGVNDDESVQYITSYATHDHWGFQIIAWGPASSRNELIDATDKLLAGWSFKGQTNAKDPESAAKNPPQVAADGEEPAE